MADIFDIAEFFIQIANSREDDLMTNLKLNKLLYYAQGVFLARTGKPLFSNRIEAWKHGPVIPEVYQKYKVCGKNPISPSEKDIDRSKFDDQEWETLLDVMRELGQYTGATLVTLTHQPGTPWSNAVSCNRSMLSQSDIRDYFQKHPVPRFKASVTIPQVSTLPNDWYDPTEDTEWEAYL